jgi:hypothetical protein
VTNRSRLPIVCTLLATALAGSSPARGHEDTEIDAAIARAVDALDALGTTWRVRDVIRDLDARYGTFADLDGDGDEDYVATEMLHGEERLTTYLREPDGWRRVARFGAEMQNRHPLLPWVVSDGGNGHPAIVVPTGWAPYFFVYRTDGAGQPEGGPQHLLGALPERLSKSFGVDNNPYALEELRPAGDGRPAEIVGTIDDTDDEEGRMVQKRWHVLLRPDRPRLSRVTGLREPPLRLDDEAIPEALSPPGGDRACEHASERRRTPLLPRATDVDDDGVLDLVVLGADFAAHVFPGVRSPSGELSFGPEASTSRPVPEPHATWWLGADGEPEEGWPALAATSLFQREFTLRTNVTADVALHLTSRYGPPFVASYFWTGRSMVPVFRNREPWPASEGRAWETVWWRDAWRDVTGDGSPDALSVGIGHRLRVEETDGATRRRRVDGDAQRPAIVFWEGESGRHAAREVAVFDIDVEAPEDVHRGLPIDIEPVRVEGSPDVDVRCIYVRPWKVGIFVEHDPARIPDDGERQRRRAALWQRRGEEIVSAPHALDACDGGLCRRGLRLVEERWRDARFCFEQASRLAPDGDARLAAVTGIARCREALGEAGQAESAPRSWTEVDRAAARRLVAVGRRAGRDGQEAAERRILTRALALDPEQSAARLRLGWKRARGEWQRSPQAAVDVESRADTSYAAAAGHRERARTVEAWRAGRLLELATADGHLVPAERLLLLDVLSHAPDHDGVHEALGHTWTGGGWARPELLAAATSLTELEASWADLAGADVQVSRAHGADMPGIEADLPVFTAGNTHHVLGMPTRDATSADALGLSLAAVPVRLRQLHAGLFGDALRPWRRRNVWLTDRKGYLAAVDAHVADAAGRRRHRAQSALDLADTTVLWCDGPREAHDLYAHTLAFRTSYYGLGRWAPDGSRAGWDAHAWFHEGLAFLTTLELYDSASTVMFTRTGTSAKREAAHEPPASRGRAACLRYVRDALLDGTALSLRQVFSRTLNDLDLLASLEAWTFLRFAAAFDPDGLRRLPAELRAAQDGSYADRSAAAVERAFGRDLDEIERLWRTFTLEVR